MKRDVQSEHKSPQNTTFICTVHSHKPLNIVVLQDYTNKGICSSSLGILVNKDQIDKNIPLSADLSDGGFCR